MSKQKVEVNEVEIVVEVKVHDQSRKYVWNTETLYGLDEMTQIAHSNIEVALQKSDYIGVKTKEEWINGDLVDVQGE